MSVSALPDYRPILQPGFHVTTVSELKTMCVNNFNPLSTTRADIMDGLEQVINGLNSVNLQADIWVDGSFVTNKANPKDVDIVVRVNGPYADAAPQPVKDAITWLTTDLMAPYLCDSYYLPVYPVGHQLYDMSIRMDAYWKGWLGFSRANNPTGIAVIELNGGVR